MSKHRLLNCEFICASSFKVNVSNKGKLLYLLMFASGDDRGFVDTTNDIINALTTNENENDTQVSLTLLNNDYESALNELIEKGYLYEFKDSHNNRVHLIRHWFYHNKLVKGLWTNYRSFLDMVYLDNNEYQMGKKPLKENNNKVNENNIDINQDKLISEQPKKDKLEKMSIEEFDQLSDEEQKKVLDEEMPF